jgi:hypothetical protein
LSKSLEDVELTAKPTVSIRDGQLVSFVSASFLFQKEEGNAGQSVRSQLSIVSNAHQESAPVTLSSIYISFNGSLDGVILRHQGNGQANQESRGKAILTTVPLTRQADTEAQAEPAESDEASTGVTLIGSADLTLRPGQTLVFNLEIPLREPGETLAESLTLNIESEAFGLRQSMTFHEGRNSRLWYLSPSATKQVAHPRPLAVHVLPRPPKMEIRCPVWKEQYYTDEPISLEFETDNGEDVEAVAKLDVVLFGEKPPGFTAEIPGQEDQSSSSVRSEETRLSGAPMGTIASSKSITVGLRLTPIERSARYDLTLKVTYFLPTNPGTPISQTAVFQLNIVNPFEANYDLLPRVHLDPWPSLFDPEGIAAPAIAAEETIPLPPKGISQAWTLITRYASFASEPLRVTDIDMAIQPSPTTFRCTSTKRTGLPPSGTGRLVNPKTIQEAAFDLSAQKLTVDDRSHAPLDISLIIKWTRADADAADSTAPTASVNTTTLPIPRFTLFGTEPRVLASVSHRRRGGPTTTPLIALTITIENASNHFLTFGLAMEPSEQFAFSGPKQTTLNLLPVSRRSVEYRLLPLDAPAGENDGKEEGEEEGEEGEGGGGWWIRPGLVVRDKYFQKVLRVIPASEGVRGGKEGFEVWVPRGMVFGVGEEREEEGDQ